jgi:hypothetical protein
MQEMLASTRFAFDLLSALPKRELERFVARHPELSAGLVDRLKIVKGALGALKLENGAKFIAEYVGLAAKMYSILMIGEDGEDESIKKGKGVPSRVLKKQATHESYKKILFEPGPSEATFRAFRSLKHSIVQLETSKRMLTAFNDKVFQLDALESRPLGHWKNDQAAAADPASSPGTAASSSAAIGPAISC